MNKRRIEGHHAKGQGTRNLVKWQKKARRKCAILGEKEPLALGSDVPEHPGQWICMGEERRAVHLGQGSTCAARWEKGGGDIKQSIKQAG